MKNLLLGFAIVGLTMSVADNSAEAGRRAHLRHGHGYSSGVYAYAPAYSTYYSPSLSIGIGHGYYGGGHGYYGGGHRYYGGGHGYYGGGHGYYGGGHGFYGGGHGYYGH